MIGLRIEKIKAEPQPVEMPEFNDDDGMPTVKVERIAADDNVQVYVEREEAAPIKPITVSISKAKPSTKVDNTTVMSMAMADKFPWTAELMAEEFGMNLAYFRAWKQKAEKEGKVTKPAIGSLLCIKDPELATRLRYSDAYFDKLKVLRGPILKKKEVNASALQHAKIKITVPVFDETVARFLLKKFADEKGIEEYLKTHLFELAKPALNKMDELKKRYEKEMAELLGN